MRTGMEDDEDYEDEEDAYIIMKNLAVGLLLFLSVVPIHFVALLFVL